MTVTAITTATEVKLDPLQLLGLEAGCQSLEEVVTDGWMELRHEEVDGEIVEGTGGSVFGERLRLSSTNVNKESNETTWDLLNFREPRAGREREGPVGNKGFQVINSTNDISIEGSRPFRLALHEVREIIDVSAVNRVSFKKSVFPLVGQMVMLMLVCAQGLYHTRA